MLHSLLEFLRTLTDPDRLIQFLSTVVTGWYSYLLLMGIVFVETGLLFGFIFPGDSLLFTIGVVTGAGQLDVTLIIVLLIISCLVGDFCGYLLGRRAGPAIFNRPDSRFFKQEYLRRTQAFYEKHGGKTIIYAKFVPIVRTFAPFVAGVANMPYRRFLPFDAIGALVWVPSMTMLGYYLGGVPLVRRHFEKFVLLVIVVSVLPVVIHAIQARSKEKRAVKTAI
ncbi:MAG TPA: VTT domain-containing protein [Bryobacteraceae bacterium]|jgi:membrane-associated protein|nr:VTT domain-containing protein [Bryobacteraceae bacterium]